MGDKTQIEWTGKTWNPWHGCVKVTDGCKFCYMYREKRKYGQDPLLVVRSKTRFNEPLKWNTPDLVFTCSWSDFFIDQADEWRAEAWQIVRRTPHLTYQILTKRTDRVLDHLPADWGDGYPNVWLGFSAENQPEFDRRWEEIKVVPATVIFISAEPLLGPIDISAAVATPVFCTNSLDPNASDETVRALKHLFKAAARSQGFRTIDWAIVGGESGTKHEDVRPMHPDWARSLRDQCVSAGIPFFFKQWGEWLPEEAMDVHSDEGLDLLAMCETGHRKQHQWWKGDPRNAINTGTSYRVGKKAAGRLLDGREWNEIPV